MCSESLIEKKECKKLLAYFEVPAKKSKGFLKSDTPFSSLVHHLREAGKVSSDDINYLMTACSDKGLSKLMVVLTLYQQAQDSKFTKTVLKDQLKALEDKRQELYHKLTESEDEKHQLTGRLKTTEEERQQLTDRLNKIDEERQQLKDTLKATEDERQQFKDALKATEEERQQLTGRLKTTEEERQQLKDTLKATVEGRLQQQKEELEEAKSSLRATKNELVKSQLEYATEPMALQEVLEQTREALNQQELVMPLSYFPRLGDDLERSIAQCDDAYSGRVVTGPSKDYYGIVTG
ncbi:glycosyl transferase GT2 family [Apostichopus japonicus]|uniref:Glycosyl transferase GT2 family n=1 Tax=Stichopus japonicus TaxID=307972 RepID=A0A2G8L4M5_STIJA|nr:glycosyl transferase GT2 family [Apostichopus japonicus]